jgi:acylphosphatase
VGRMSEVVARRVTVHGMVQGVGFRYHAVHEAHRLGVNGWVSNEVDGTVTGVFEGTADAVEALVAWCREGPGYARVDRVDVEPASPSGARSFSVR